MKKNHWLIMLTLLVTLPLLMGQALAAPTGADGLAQGNDFLVSRAISLRHEPAMAYNNDLDEYLVVWADSRTPENYSNTVYGQIVSSSGVPRGDNFVIRYEATHQLGDPDVAYDTDNGRYLVVWGDETESDIEGQLLDQDGNAFGAAFNVVEVGFNKYPAVAFHPPTDTYFVVYSHFTSEYNIQGKRVNADGSVVATEYDICTAAGEQTDPDVSVDPANDGDFLVVWEDKRAADDQIYGTLFYATTWFLGVEFPISSRAGSDFREPAVAFSPDAGEWMVVSRRFEAGDYYIVGRRVTAAGATVGNAFGICSDAGSHQDPTVAYNTASDQFLVAWMDWGGDGIYGRRVDSGGSTAGDVFAIDTGSSRFYPAVAASPAAPGYLVAFVNGRATNIADIVGQRVGTGGALEGHAFVLSAPVGDQNEAAVAYNSTDDEYLVVWEDERDGNWDIWGQRLDVDGDPLDDSFTICTDGSAQAHPDVAYNLDTNQYLVVWEDRRTDADIYGQRVNADGSLDGAEIGIAGAGSTARRRPHVAFSPASGEYLVVYVYEDENNNIRGRRVPAAGTPSTGEIDIATGATDQNYPDIACRAVEPGGGGYLVVWRDTDGAIRDIRGQRLNPTGGLLGGALDICTQASDQWAPAVAYSPDDDRYLAAWPDSRDSATQGRNIYGRQVGGAGTLYDEFAISTASGNQLRVAITYDGGAGSYVVAWDDSRHTATEPDLYGQRVSGSGELIETPAGTNDPLFVYSGGQQTPALAWAGDGAAGLLVWEDGRNGLSYDIYGLLLGLPAGANRIFLPLVIRN